MNYLKGTIQDKFGDVRINFRLIEYDQSTDMTTIEDVTIFDDKYSRTTIEKLEKDQVATIVKNELNRLSDYVESNSKDFENLVKGKKCEFKES